MKRTIQIIAFLFLLNILLSFSCNKTNDAVSTTPPPPGPDNSALQHTWILDSVEVYNNSQFSGQWLRRNSAGGSIIFSTDNKAYSYDSVQIHTIQLTGHRDTFNYALSSDNKYLFTHLLNNGIPYAKADTSSVILLTDTRLTIGMISPSPIDSSFVYGLSSNTVVYPKFYYHR